MRALRIVLVAASQLWWLPLTAVGVLIDRNARARWLCVPGLVGLTTVVSTTGKATVRRPRPSTERGSPDIGRMGLRSSFPSTHTACAFAIASWVSHTRKWPYLLATGVAYARVRKRA